MMKFKIVHKIWLAIMATVLLIISVLWLLQVVFLEDYYLKRKHDEILKNTKQIVEILLTNGIQGSMEDIYQIALENTLCVDISSQVGRPMVTYEGLGENCFLHMNEHNRYAFVQEAIDSAGEYFVTNVKHPKYETSYYTCAVTVNDQYTIIVTTTLAAVKEATMIIRTQLLYISIILVLIATAVSFLIARLVTKPIRKISNAAKEIANGNLQVDVTVNSHDELGELSESFKDMAQELSKVSVLQKELVANISHDMRTPLTMIKGYAETIKDLTGDNKELREQQLDIIVEEANRLSTLVSDVMDLSLLQARQTSMNFEPFDLALKVSEILGRFQLLEQTSGFHFTLVSDPSVIVLGDELRIEQVLYNLISNAINHMGEQKQIVVTITDFEGNIRVEVSDTGTGIKQEDLHLIWDRYYKPYKNTEQKSVGTGLGLSIVKAILIEHQSQFGVVSTLGEGSTFWFTIKKQECGGL